MPGDHPLAASTMPSAAPRDRSTHARFDRACDYAAVRPSTLVAAYALLYRAQALLSCTDRASRSRAPGDKQHLAADLDLFLAERPLVLIGPRVAPGAASRLARIDAARMGIASVATDEAIRTPPGAVRLRMASDE